jgi:IS605 OrfB family transposase
VNVVVRSATIGLRVSGGRRARCFALLVAAGDVWAWVLDCNLALRSWGLRPVVNYQRLCAELADTGVDVFGELGTTGCRSVLRRYADAWMEAARRRRGGDCRAGFPRRKRRLMPVRWYHGTFIAMDERHVRVGLARGAPELILTLARPIPYPLEQLRCVELAANGGRLQLTVTAEVTVIAHPDADPRRVAGVDLGIIHPYAVAGPDSDALVVSGRALRAEHRLHLADTKARQRQMATKVGRHRARPGRPATTGSRRWRRLRAAQCRAETHHRARIRQAHHRAAAEVVRWCVERRVGTLVVGDPAGICAHDSGPVHNKRLRDWSRTHLMGCLVDKATLHAITVVVVDERGTSSTCPACGQRAPKPRGRAFRCPACQYHGHRDLVGAHNIARRTGGIPQPVPTVVEHRRAGLVPARRDRRRHRWDHQRRHPPVLPRPGPPATQRESHATPGVDHTNTTNVG